MGNSIVTPCFHPKCSSTVKLISYGGATRILTGKHLAGEITFQFPDQMLCHADSFFIGHRIPSLDIDDELIGGQTYFLLPLDCFTHNVLSVSSLSGLGSGSGLGQSKRGGPVPMPFEYVKDRDGRVLIKVAPEFITRLITRGGEIGEKEIGDGGDAELGNSGKGFLCSTPELKKHYNQLVGCSKDQIWSPKLETISEYKIRFSPCRFLGLEWREEEV